MDCFCISFSYIRSATGDQERFEVSRMPRYWKESTLSRGLFETDEEGW